MTIKKVLMASAFVVMATVSHALAGPLRPGEIAPTPDMLARAARTIPPEAGEPPLEYHFRRLGETDVVVCAYHGGNGEF